ncbi:MAG TPA: glycosyltransferase [Nitrososphaera sp.]|jgi:cellulose synthase/poly-beta-1,6-N-acetylglucosamine synthase-like glycosyltransferase|nr:glycosyltransferase [Nitrososphaera sp.]
MYGPGNFLYLIFITVATVTMIYTLNFYYLAYQSHNNIKHEKRRRQKVEPPASMLLPSVTIQLPLYNEKYVAKRLIDTVCKMDYPKDRLEIQVLDDSDDDTVDLIRSIVDEYRFKGFDIVHMHRTDRSGYKAGALKAGMKTAKGEFVAIFDADFIPPSWFLKKAVGHFYADPKLGLVQCKWGHVNEKYSTLTEAQAVSLDLHFLVEQKAKSLGPMFMNFNGTAGIWRSSCISDAGGWHTSTLVEDLDLSYRAQMKGWKCLFLEDIVVDAELPVQMNAAKRQQFRWAKGGVQVAMKLTSDIMLHRRVPIEAKVQAFLQLTRHIVHPLFLVQFLVIPMLLAVDYTLYTTSWAPILAVAMYVMMGPGGYLLVINRTWKHKWRGKARQFLFLMFFSSGLSVNNTVAVFDAVAGKKNEFLRTPKFGIVNKGDDWRGKEYVLPFTKTTLLEIFFAIYGCMGVFIAIVSRNPVVAPTLAIPTIGFIYIAYLSIVHSTFGKKRKAGLTIATGKSLHSSVAAGNDAGRKRLVSPRAVLAGVIAFLIMGAGFAYYGYLSTMYPVNEAIGFMARAETAQTPEQLAEYIRLTQNLIPEKGNPVWLFPTLRTDFTLIHAELHNIVVRAAVTSNMPPHGEAYNAAMRDMHETSNGIRSDLKEALPYMYVSLTNIVLGTLWVAAIIAIFAVMRKARTKYAQQQYKTVS